MAGKPASPSADETEAVLARIVGEAEGDPTTLGVLLQGSYATGDADAESDFDLIWVLTSEELERREAAGESLHVRRPADGALLDIAYSSPQRLRDAVRTPGWWSPGLASSQLLVDKTGALAPLHRELTEMGAETATTQVREEFDGYLNSFYRSLKAWRRGDELAGRIEAAESVMYLVRTLFALERRWAPYPNRLRARLAELSTQGWTPGELERQLLQLVSTGDPVVQQRLEERVEALLRSRGYGDVADSWDGEIERVRAFTF